MDSSMLPDIIKMLHDPRLIAKSAAILELGGVCELTKTMHEMNARNEVDIPPYVFPLTGRRIWPSIPTRSKANRCSLCGEKMFRCIRTADHMLFKCPNHHHAWVRR